MSQFKDKVVLVTGAAGSLGKAVVAAFAEQDAKVLLLDINDDVLKNAFPQSSAANRLGVNLMDPAAVMAAVNKSTTGAGRIDVLVNVAGGFRMGPSVHETPADMWDLMLNLNATSVVNVARAVVPKMLAQGGGKIVSVAAGAGVRGQPNMGAYSASKSMVLRLTESMASELREKNINVNCVMPSIIDTPFNRAEMPNADFSKWVAPEALADIIVFLSSDASRAIHGAAVPATGLS